MSRSASPGASVRALRIRRWLVLSLAAVTVTVAGFHAWTFWQVWRLRDHNPGTTAFMRLGLERLQSDHPGARLQRRWVPYERISANLKRAVIAGEDQRFLEHDGFDVEAIEEAHALNRRGARVRHGGSTISQQLAKNLFLSPRRTWLRKAQEAEITMMLEHALSKRRILEIYLNVIEWGTGIYGAEAAAQHYFSKSAAELDPEEAARLAAMIPSPRSYTGNPNTPYLDERTEVLLGAMEHVRAP